MVIRGRRRVTRAAGSLAALAWRCLPPALVLAAAVATLVGPAGPDEGRMSAGDVALARLLAAKLPALRAADQAAAAGRGSIAAIQEQYDLSRDFDQAIAALPAVTHGCKKLKEAATAYADGQIKEAEGFDRPSPAVLAAGVRKAAAANRDLGRLPLQCSKGMILSAPAQHKELGDPKSDEAFPGLLRFQGACGNIDRRRRDQRTPARAACAEGRSRPGAPDGELRGMERQFPFSEGPAVTRSRRIAAGLASTSVR